MERQLDDFEYEDARVRSDEELPEEARVLGIFRCLLKVGDPDAYAGNTSHAIAGQGNEVGQLHSLSKKNVKQVGGVRRFENKLVDGTQHRALR